MIRLTAAAFLAIISIATIGHAAEMPLPVPLNPVVASAAQTCDTITPSGLGYKILLPGEGALPPAGAFVLVRYIGYLRSDGTVFDQNAQAVFSINGVVPGFGEGLALMRKGAIYRLCIPSALGYGAEANDPIPASSDLGFQVELVDFKSADEVEKMRAAQSAGVEAQATDIPHSEK